MLCLHCDERLYSEKGKRRAHSSNEDLCECRIIKALVSIY